MRIGLCALAVTATARPNTAAKPARPLQCRPHSGTPAAATNARRGGSDCGWRDARARHSECASERGRVGLSRKFGGGPALPEIMALGGLIMLYAAAGGGSAAADAWAFHRKRS